MLGFLVTPFRRRRRRARLGARAHGPTRLLRPRGGGIYGHECLIIFFCCCDREVQSNQPKITNVKPRNERPHSHRYRVASIRNQFMVCLRFFLLSLKKARGMSSPMTDAVSTLMRRAWSCNCWGDRELQRPFEDVEFYSSNEHSAQVTTASETAVSPRSVEERCVPISLELCCICLDPLPHCSYSDTTAFPCSYGHVLHTECLQRYTEFEKDRFRRATCPFCRGEARVQHIPADSRP